MDKQINIMAVKWYKNTLRSDSNTVSIVPGSEPWELIRNIIHFMFYLYI